MTPDGSNIRFNRSRHSATTPIRAPLRPCQRGKFLVHLQARILLPPWLRHHGHVWCHRTTSILHRGGVLVLLQNGELVFGAEPASFWLGRRIVNGHGPIVDAFLQGCMVIRVPVSPRCDGWLLRCLTSPRHRSSSSGWLEIRRRWSMLNLPCSYCSQACPPSLAATDRSLASSRS
jgi:hypothetical protein